MYTNINTNHTIKDERKLPPDFKTKMIIQAAKVRMKWNIFKLGDTFFKQLLGTAMCTPAAVIFVMNYFLWHEKHILIPKHGRKMPLMKIFVDDIYAIVLVGGEDGIAE